MYRSLAALLAACAFACAPSEQDILSSDALATSHGDVTTGTAHPTLTFNADWSVSTSGTLVAGKPVRIRYDLSRLESCRASQWFVSMFYRGPHSHRHDQGFVIDAEATFLETWAILPFGDEVEFWFEASDFRGCRAFDSDYGRNHRIAAQQPAVALHFAPDWSLRTTGTPAPGGSVVIDFDLWRVPYCVGVTQFDTLGGEATMFYRFDGGPISSVPLLGIPEGLPEVIDGQPGRFQIPPSLEIPADAAELELWFLGENDHNPWQPCANWDSNYGENYRVRLR